MSKAIPSDLAAIDSELGEIHDETKSILDGNDAPTPGQITRLERLYARLQALDSAKNKILSNRSARLEAMESGVRDGSLQVHSGSGPDALAEERRPSRNLDYDRDPLRDSRDIRRVKNRNPWTAGAVPIRTLTDDNSAVSELRSRAFDAIEVMSGASDKGRENATRAVEQFDDPAGNLSRYVLAASDPDYLRAFTAYLRGDQDLMSPDERAAVRRVREVQRAMSLTDTAGGHMVPLTLDPSIMLSSDGYENPFRKICRRVLTATDEWKGVTSAGVTMSFDAEAAEVSDDAPTLADAVIPNHKAQGFIPYSIEVGMDAVNLTGELMTLFADGKDDLEGEKFTTGTGTNEPTGILTGLPAGSIVATATADTYVAGDVYKLYDELPPRFRKRAVWMARAEIINKTRQFGTADGHAFLTHLSDDQPERLLGKRLYEASEMDGTIDLAADNDILLFFDPRHYVIADRAGFVVELVPHLFATANNRPSGQRGLYAWWRVGAERTVDAAVHVLRA